MTALLRKDFICLFLKNSSSVPFSISLHFYSTSRAKKPVVNAAVYDFLLHKYQFSPNSASQAASVLTRLRNPEKSDSILSFLKENGFSNTQLEKIVKYSPGMILGDLEKSIKPKIAIFQDFGFSANDIAKVVANNPSIFHRSADNCLSRSLIVLKGLFGSNEEVVKLVTKSGWFLANYLDKTMVPNIEFLRSCSVPMEQILRCMRTFPRFLLNKPETVRKAADKVEEMGIKSDSGMFICGVRVVCSMTDETWELKLQTFRSLGFSEDDIFRAFRKSPPSFAVSVKKMKKIKDFLVSSGKYSTACIVSHPRSLNSSIEKRYKPRLQVLAILEGKNLITKWPSLTTLFTLSNEAFSEKFVSPYLDKIGTDLAKLAVISKREGKLMPST